MANYVPALTPRMATCCGPRTADLCTRMDSGDTRAIACSSGVQPGGGMGPATFCLALRPGLKRFREEFEGEGVEAFAYMDDVSLGLMGVTANTVRVFLCLPPARARRLLIVVDTAKTMALPPPGHARRRRVFRSGKR